MTGLRTIGRNAFSTALDARDESSLRDAIVQWIRAQSRGTYRMSTTVRVARELAFDLGRKGAYKVARDLAANPTIADSRVGSDLLATLRAIDGAYRAADDHAIATRGAHGRLGVASTRPENAPGTLAPVRTQALSTQRTAQDTVAQWARDGHASGIPLADLPLQLLPQGERLEIPAPAAIVSTLRSAGAGYVRYLARQIARQPHAYSFGAGAALLSAIDTIDRAATLLPTHATHDYRVAERPVSPRAMLDSGHRAATLRALRTQQARDGSATVAPIVMARIAARLDGAFVDAAQAASAAFHAARAASSTAPQATHVAPCTMGIRVRRQAHTDARTLAYVHVNSRA